MKKICLIPALLSLMIPPLSARCGQAESLSAAGLERYLGTDWYGVYFMGQKMGCAVTGIKKTEYEGKAAVNVSLKLEAKVAMMGTDQEMEIVEDRTYILTEGLAYFLHETTSAGAKTKITGKLSGGRMKVCSDIGGEKKERIIERPKERFEDYIAMERLVTAGAKVGDSVTFTEYEPTLQKNITAISRVREVREKMLQGVPGKIYILETVIKDLGITSISEVSGEGELMETQVAGVFTLRLEDEKTAKNIDYRSDLILSTVVRPDKKIKNPEKVMELQALITGVSDPSALKDTPRQKFVTRPGREVLVKIRVQPLEGINVPKLPIKKEEFPADLSPSLFVQSDNPEIVKLSKEIAGGETDAVKVSDRIVEWVYGNIRKEFSAAFSNALDVLALRAGDCTEHSVLYVALARAAGLPAREISGLVYSNSDGGFYYHQWAEAYVGKWIEVDPTFGQTQADATHIRLAGGDLASQASIINLVGSMKIKILEYGYGKKN
jgi:hypothetical protein